MSYTNGGGGTLTLPSPTHVRHVDVTSGLRSLRRSLSRSPSKFNLKSPNSPTSTPKTPHSPLPVSPPLRFPQQTPSLVSGAQTPGIHTPSQLAKPFPPSVKLSLRSARTKTLPPRASSVTRTSPRSPLKRALSQASDNGNSVRRSSSESASGRENSRSGSGSPTERRSLENKTSMPLFIEVTAPLNMALSRLGDGTSDSGSPVSSTSSPLKRSDAIMNLDRASLGSPVAKRRSLHGSASFGHDFNVFDHGPTSLPHFDIHDDSNQEYELSATSGLNGNSALSSALNMPRRSSSLRKSTLQQRTDKSSWGRRHAAAHELALLSGETVTPVASKTRPRLSLDQFIPPMSRDSPFSAQGSLPNASVHIVNQSHQPHPLSRTMTQSSSGSSLVDDSPTHAPPHFGEQPRPKLDFSKSLPLGAIRPLALDALSREESGSFATPDNYKNVKPLPAAFMSTGLVSKVNRHPELLPIARGAGKGAMPDTPCKKSFNGLSTLPPQVPGSVIAKARHIRHSFGSPSTPFNPHHGGARPAHGTFGKGTSVFGSAFGNKGLTRRSSFLSMESIDADEGSPETRNDSQSSDMYDLPHTPTKQFVLPGSHEQQGTASAHTSRQIPPSTSAVGHGLTHARTSTSPLDRVNFTDRLSPHTPHEGMLPPDPSRLSISNRRVSQHVSSSASMPPPATPTTERDYFTTFGEKRLSITPLNGFTVPEVDEVLTSRFENVELIGTGEFSQVFRVTQPSVAPTSAQSFFFASPSTKGRSPPTPLPEQVFAVKKSRQPYAGARDRQRKLQEVNVLRALGHSDHVVHLMDSWDWKDHLYIQTEFCEEGSLDLFLATVGRRGRLDDFRIWKIMLELSQGLQHIHDSGFIHLDLKPANILITFEGVLKIGDFGMATSWPAPPGIEGEGDREYIGPEILLGQYDKPADIFALGLIMLEIAGNVQLPDNGPTWQRLRSGDMSDVPSLTWSSASTIHRDATGIPLDESNESLNLLGSDDDIDLSPEFGSPTAHSQSSSSSARKRHSMPPLKPSSTSPHTYHNAANLFGTAPSSSAYQHTHHSPSSGSSSTLSQRQGELRSPPPFMRDPLHPQALDRVVRWMISPEPRERPVVGEILAMESVCWIGRRARSGATVFEGSWGPGDEVLGMDAEMIDV